MFRRLLQSSRQNSVGTLGIRFASLAYISCRIFAVAWWNPPAGKLGIVHFSLLDAPTRASLIPQPGGWGSLIPAYLELPSPCRHMQSLIEYCNLAHIGWNQQSSTPVGRFQKL